MLPRLSTHKCYGHQLLFSQESFEKAKAAPEYGQMIWLANFRFLLRKDAGFAYNQEKTIKDTVEEAGFKAECSLKEDNAVCRPKIKGMACSSSDGGNAACSSDLDEVCSFLFSMDSEAL